MLKMLRLTHENFCFEQLFIFLLERNFVKRGVVGNLINVYAVDPRLNLTLKKIQNVQNRKTILTKTLKSCKKCTFNAVRGETLLDRTAFQKLVKNALLAFGCGK